MADSVDRVFVHALNTVKKIPKTGASRPPHSDRLRLYGLYKQAMEGDVDGVMERPSASPNLTSDEVQRERDKWDAWSSQKGLTRTEAKRRYIEALIDTGRRSATTADAKELVSELEFVWNQVRSNNTSAASPPSSSQNSPTTRRLQQQQQQQHESQQGDSGPLRALPPMSELDEAELRSQRQMDLEDEEEEAAELEAASSAVSGYNRNSNRWQKKVERAVTSLSAEVAALREQISSGREWRSKKARSLPAWIRWLAWAVLKHLLADVIVLIAVLLWMRRRKDGRLEDLVRAGLTLMREYARNVLPSR